MSHKEKQWIPIESNPQLINKYIHSLGVDEQWSFVDVLGTDDMLLQMVPQPVLAVGLLYPITENSERHNREEEEKLNAATDDEANNPTASNQLSDLWYTHQTVGNACGTIMLLHCIYNNLVHIQLKANSFFANFYKKTQPMTPQQRAAALEEDDSIEVEHQSLATEATSDVEHACNENLHFIAFVHHSGHLYELDGRKQRAIAHGPTTPQSLLQDSVKVIEQFMARDPMDIRFNMCALVPTQDD